MMLLSLSDYYSQSQKNLFKPNMCISFRSNSHEQIRHKPSSHRRSDSTHSVDLFKLIIPTNTDSTFSSLLCPICSLPMLKPTTLPCQHTFCLRCIQNYQQVRPVSLPVHSNDFLSCDTQTKILTCQKCFRVHQINSLTDLIENQSMELLINTLLCETCHQLYPSKELDTCLHCYGVHCLNCYDEHLKSHPIESKVEKNFYPITSTEQTANNSQLNSDSQTFKTQSSNTDKKSTSNESTKSSVDQQNHENETVDSTEVNHPKKKSNSLLRKFMNPSRHRQSNSPSPKTPSSPIKQSPLVKTANRLKPILSVQIIENAKKEPASTSPVTPVRQFLNLFDQYTHIDQQVSQYKKRQSELDRSVHKMIDVLTMKTNENLERISFYWIYLKQIILDQYEMKTERFQLFDYLLKTCCSPVDARKHTEVYIQKNDEVNASLQIVSSTLTIVKDQQTLVTINQLFDREEQTTIRTLRRQFDSLIAAYTDELSFIVERFNVYDSRFAAWKNSNMSDLNSTANELRQIVEHEYPSLIEKVANDFVTKIPQVEIILAQMLRNMKQRLLNNQTPSRRTSDS